MLEPTKKPLTEDIQEARFLGPAKKIKKLSLVAKSLGLVDLSDSIPWREAFPEFEDEDYPAVALRGARRKEDMTQKQLAELTGIPQSHISEMEHGKRGIGKERAKRLGKALNITYRVFL